MGAGASAAGVAKAVSAISTDELEATVSGLPAAEKARLAAALAATEAAPASLLATSDVNIPAAAFEIGAALCVLDDVDGKATALLDKVGPRLAEALQQIEGLSDPAAGDKSELPQRRKLVERMRKIQGNLSPKCDQVGRCRDGSGDGEAAKWDQSVGLNNPWLQQQLCASRGDYCNRLTKIKAIMEFGAAVHQFLHGGKFPELPELLGKHGIIEKQHVEESLALFERLNIASTAFAGNRDRWERVPLCLQKFFDAPRQPQEGEQYLEERMAKVYTQAKNVDHLDGFGDMIDWKKLETLALAGNLAEVGLTQAEYDAFMAEYIKEWPKVNAARATLRRRKANKDMVDMSLILVNAPSVAVAKAVESSPAIAEKGPELEMSVAALKAAVKIQAIARGREDRLRVTASDEHVKRSVRANVPQRYRAPMAAEQPARPGLLSDAAAHNLGIDPALGSFKAAGLLDALAAHDFPHGTGMNRWDVRPGKYAQSVVGAGGAVAGAQSAGTAYTLFGLQLLTGAKHLDVAIASAEKQEFVYAVGLMVASFMNFGAYHSFLETFPIVEALAADVPFFEGSVGPVFNGEAPATYSSIVSKINEYTAAGSKAEAFLSAYQTASKQPSLAPRSLGGDNNLHAAILIADAA